MTFPLRRARRVALSAALTAVAALSVAGCASTTHSPVTAPVGGAVRTPAAERAQPAAGVTVVGASTGVHAAAPAPGPGYVYLNSRMTGESPHGFQVWVDPKAKNHTSIAAGAAAAISRLRSFGLPVTWRGYGVAKAAEGVIDISEGTQGCVGAANRVANTYPYFMKLPNGDLYMYRSTIVMCPTLYKYSSWQWNATVAHELGHAMGLNHTNYVYAGHYQLMNAVNHTGVTTYQAGDITGLRKLAANSTRIKKEVVPAGRFDNSAYNAKAHAVTIYGWTYLKWYPTSNVLVSITDNGKLVWKGYPNAVRADVNKAYKLAATSRHGFQVNVPWKTGTHAYCVSVTSTLSSVSHISLGCSTWHS